jgi:hypothetical protein
MRLYTRLTLALAPALLLVPLLGACGRAESLAPAAAPTLAPPAAVATPGDRLFVRELSGDAGERLAVIDSTSGARQRELPPGVIAPDWSTLYTAAPAGGQTRVEALDLATGDVLRSITIDGRYDLPMVTPDSVLGGLAPGGGWLALAASQAGRTQFAVLDTAFKQPPRTAELTGLFHFDGLSADGRSLYLTESLGADPNGKYQVRRYDLGMAQLDPNVIVAKGESEVMNGVRQAAVASRDGAWLYSLYLNPEHGPFIHALNLNIPLAFCLDLPKSAKADLARQARWSLVLSADGRRLYAANGAIGQVAEVDVGGDFPTIARTSALFDAPAGAANLPAQASGLSALSPDGSLLYTLGDAGLLVIDTKPLALRGRYLADWSLDGLAISPDGARLYAASAAKGKIVRLDPRAGTIVAEVPAAGAPAGVVYVLSSLSS